MTYHYKEERTNRKQIIKSIGGYGKPLFVDGKPCIFYVDRGHKDGPEYHVITDNAIILIYNAWDYELVTALIARPGQLKRYGVWIPQWILSKAEEHKQKKLNK